MTNCEDLKTRCQWNPGHERRRDWLEILKVLIFGGVKLLVEAASCLSISIPPSSLVIWILILIRNKVDVWQKPIKFYKAIILQLKNKLKKKHNGKAHTNIHIHTHKGTLSSSKATACPASLAASCRPTPCKIVSCVLICRSVLKQISALTTLSHSCWLELKCPLTRKELPANLEYILPVFICVGSVLLSYLSCCLF